MFKPCAYVFFSHIHVCYLPHMCLYEHVHYFALLIHVWIVTPLYVSVPQQFNFKCFCAFVSNISAIISALRSLSLPYMLLYQRLRFLHLLNDVWNMTSLYVIITIPLLFWCLCAFVSNISAIISALRSFSLSYVSVYQRLRFLHLVNDVWNMTSLYVLPTFALSL